MFGKSIIKIQRCSPEISLSAIDNIAQRLNTAFAIVEMDITTENEGYRQVEEKLLQAGYTDMKYILSPTKTSYIDLSVDDDRLLHSFDKDIQKHLKRNFHKPIAYLASDNLELFYSILSEFSQRQHVYIQPKKTWIDKWKPFGLKTHVLLAYMGDALLGANMFILTPPRAYGIFIPTTELGKEHQIAANLIWEGMKQAKNAGCTIFDLNGMYDERYKAPLGWKGLTQFKRKFKGHEVEFMRPKVKTYSPYFRLLSRLDLLWIYLVDST